MSEVSKPRKNATNTQITKDDRIEHALLKNELIYKLFNSGLYVKEILSILGVIKRNFLPLLSEKEIPSFTEDRQPAVVYDDTICQKLHGVSGAKCGGDLRWRGQQHICVSCGNEVQFNAQNATHYNANSAPIGPVQGFCDKDGNTLTKKQLIRSGLKTQFHSVDGYDVFARRVELKTEISRIIPHIFKVLEDLIVDRFIFLDAKLSKNLPGVIGFIIYHTLRDKGNKNPYLILEIASELSIVHSDILKASRKFTLTFDEHFRKHTSKELQSYEETL